MTKKLEEYQKYWSKSLANRDDLILDIRSEKQFELGSMPGAINISLNKEHLSNSFLQKKWQLKVAHAAKVKSKIILVDQDGSYWAKCAFEWLKLKYDTYIYKGGIKNYRKWVKAETRKERQLFVLYGNTGVGKSELLNRLAPTIPTLPLNRLAHHNGSVFGNIPDDKTISQIDFENEIATQLSKFDIKTPVLCEYEHIGLGKLQIPPALFENIKRGIPIYIYAQKGERVKRLVKEYANVNDMELAKGIMKLKHKIGNQKTEALLTLLNSKAYAEVAESLIEIYDAAAGYNIFNADNAAFAVCTDSLDEAAASLQNIWQKKTSPEEDATVKLDIQDR